MKKHRKSPQPDIKKSSKRKFKPIWLLAFLIPIAFFLFSFIYTGRIINLNPGCTDAFVTSIVETTSVPTKTGPGQKMFRVHYQYDANGKTYQFKENFSWMELWAIKGMKNPSSLSSLSVSIDEVRYIPIKYYKNFPRFHSITKKCEEN